jgi:hypothetical protein
MTIVRTQSSMEAIVMPHTCLRSCVDDADSRLRCARAVRLLHTHRGHVSAEVDALIAEDPHCVYAHALRAALIVRSGETTSRKALAASVSLIEAACPDQNEPMRRHAAAARAWLDGSASLALERYGAIVADAPLDIVALVVAHALDFQLGERKMLEKRIARVLPHWNESMQGCASVLAMHAFGLVENGNYRRAENAARRALVLDPGHPGAIHAIAHVMEMQGRAREGLAFLAATEEAWAHDTAFSVHLAWHRALFHLDLENRAAALAIYDQDIVSAAPTLPALADASALLWRCHLRGMNVRERWRLLAERWQAQPLAEVRSFYAVHALMAFAAAGHAAAAQVLADVAAASAALRQPGRPEDRLVDPLCRALVAFASGRYLHCIRLLGQVRHIAHRCGGSLAQCDIIHLTFTEAALRAPKALLARTLVAERATQKPQSRLNRWLSQRVELMPAMG